MLLHRFAVKPEDKTCAALAEHLPAAGLWGDVQEQPDGTLLVLAAELLGVTKEQAELCLENLFVFLDCVAYFYAHEYEERRFDKSLLELTVNEALVTVPDADVDIKKLIEENKALKNNNYGL